MVRTLARGEHFRRSSNPGSGFSARIPDATNAGTSSDPHAGSTTAISDENGVSHATNTVPGAPGPTRLSAILSASDASAICTSGPGHASNPRSGTYSDLCNRDW